MTDGFNPFAPAPSAQPEPPYYLSNYADGRVAVCEVGTGRIVQWVGAQPAEPAPSMPDHWVPIELLGAPAAFQRAARAYAEEYAALAFRSAQPRQEPQPIGHVATVAEVHMSRYTVEWTNGPLPEGTKLYAGPMEPRQDPPKQTVTPYNVGRWCMGEDECRALGIDFAAYERGVLDAAQAFGRNK